jgi:drug/metabolite transporter (DMT)-like permease
MTPPLQLRAWFVAIAAMLTALFFWAVLPLFLEHFTHVLDPWTVNGMRYFFSAAFWLPFVIRSLRQRPPAERRALWKAALVPAAAHGVCQVFFGFAPYYNNATMLNFGCRLSIPFTTLFGFWLLKSERPLARSRGFWLGLACAIGGFLLMFENGFGSDSTSPIGMLLLLGFAVTWGLYVVFVRRNLSGIPPHLSYGIVSLLAFPPLLALMIGLGDWHALLRLPWDQWLWLALSAILGLALSHVLFYRAILTMGPIASEGSMLLIPFQTALLAHFFLDERLSLTQWGAGALLIAGCMLIIRARFTARG